MFNRDQRALTPYAPFPSIKRLYVASAYPTYVMDLFVTFPNICELCMIKCSNPEYPHDGVDLLSPPQLHSLIFSSCPIDSLLRPFIGKRIIPTNLFAIEGLRHDDVPVVGVYFSMFGDVLRGIRIGFDCNHRGPDVLGTSDVTFRSAITHLLFPSARFCDDARLECLTGLRYLTINTGYYTGYYSQRFSARHIKLLVSILEKIPSSTLQKLHIEIPTPSSTMPRMSRWHRIGEVLQQRGFPQLTELVFIPSLKPCEYFERWIREDLHVLDERGILSVR